jgi:hypothetical protein
MEVTFKSSVVPVPIRDQALARLLTYWDEKRGTREFPARADIDPLDLGYVLGNVILVDVFHNPMRFHIRLYGSNLAHRMNFDMTGQDLDDHPCPDFRARVARDWRQTVESRQVTHLIVDEWMDDRHVRYESLRLPLSTDGHVVDMLLVAVVDLDVHIRP